MGDVWEWGAKVGGHSWRTAGDLGMELDRIIDIALKNAEHRQWSKPRCVGTIPDYLQIRLHRQRRHRGLNLGPCPLTPNEQQYSFMSLWCPDGVALVLQRRRAETRRVFARHPLQCGGHRDRPGSAGPMHSCTVTLGDDGVLFVKDLEDRSKAVGLCNRSEMEIDIAAKWSDPGLQRQAAGPRLSGGKKDLGEIRRFFQHSSRPPRHRS